jgi:hypothetical protein
MPEGHQEHGCITMAVAVIACCLDEPLDLLFGQMLARPQGLVGQPAGNCSFYTRWRSQFEMRFWHGKVPTQWITVRNMGLLPTVVEQWDAYLPTLLIGSSTALIQ